MSYKFCKKCGTLYNESDGECPRCADRRLTDEGKRDTVYDRGMSAEELEKKAQKRLEAPRHRSPRLHRLHIPRVLPL